ncbi:MAG: hypothetical protein ACI846_000140 [Pseudoalteromonas distincta]|jgi:hypothetical protein
MDSIVSYVTAVSIEQVYFLALGVCVVISSKIKRVFELSLIAFLFNGFSHLILFDYLISKGVEHWVIGWSIYELLIIVCIVFVRIKVNKNGTKFILSDIILIAGSVTQILIYALTYLAKQSGSSVMDVIYAATAPTLYILTIVVLSFPSIYKMVGYFKGYKEFNGVRKNGHRGNSSRGVFSARYRDFILGN